MFLAHFFSSSILKLYVIPLQFASPSPAILPSPAQKKNDAGATTDRYWSALPPPHPQAFKKYVSRKL